MDYVAAVRQRSFPDASESYKICDEQWVAFQRAEGVEVSGEVVNPTSVCAE